MYKEVYGDESSGKSWSFGFVREPISRTMSGYHEESMPGSHPHYAEYKGGMEGRVAHFEHYIDKGLSTTHTDPQLHNIVSGMGGLHFALGFVGDMTKSVKLMPHILDMTATVPQEITRQFFERPRERVRGEDGGGRPEFNVSPSEINDKTRRRICELYFHDYCCLGFDFPKACDEQQGSIDHMTRMCKTWKTDPDFALPFKTHLP